MDEAALKAGAKVLWDKPEDGVRRGRKGGFRDGAHMYTHI